MKNLEVERSVGLQALFHKINVQTGMKTYLKNYLGQEDYEYDLDVLSVMSMQSGLYSADPLISLSSNFNDEYSAEITERLKSEDFLAEMNTKIFCSCIDYKIKQDYALQAEKDSSTFYAADIPKISRSKINFYFTKDPMQGFSMAAKYLYFVLSDIPFYRSFICRDMKECKAVQMFATQFQNFDLKFEDFRIIADKNFNSLENAISLELQGAKFIMSVKDNPYMDKLCRKEKTSYHGIESLSEDGDNIIYEQACTYADLLKSRNKEVALNFKLSADGLKSLYERRVISVVNFNAPDFFKETREFLLGLKTTYNKFKDGKDLNNVDLQNMAFFTKEITATGREYLVENLKLVEEQKKAFGKTAYLTNDEEIDCFEINRIYSYIDKIKDELKLSKSFLMKALDAREFLTRNYRDSLTFRWTYTYLYLDKLLTTPHTDPAKETLRKRLLGHGIRNGKKAMGTMTDIFVEFAGEDKESISVSSRSEKAILLAQYLDIEADFILELVKNSSCFLKFDVLENKSSQLVFNYKI